MKQTAVEWLIERFETYFEKKVYIEKPDLIKMLELAKEIEKQQQGYSEEDMIAFGEFIFKHSLLTHTRGVKSLFEQFKNK